MPKLLRWLTVLAALMALQQSCRTAAAMDSKDPRVHHCIERGLDWIANTQSRVGSWSAKDGMYPTAMTALAGMALLQEGSTTTQGKYAANIRRAVDYLCLQSRQNGLIGNPTKD